MLHTKFSENRLAGSGEGDFCVVFTTACRFWRRRFLRGFYHIWAWRPSWSCPVNKLSFPLPMDAPNKISTSEKKIFEIVDDDDGQR